MGFFISVWELSAETYIRLELSGVAGRWDPGRNFGIGAVSNPLIWEEWDAGLILGRVPVGPVTGDAPGCFHGFCTSNRSLGRSDGLVISDCVRRSFRAPPRVNVIKTFIPPSLAAGQNKRACLSKACTFIRKFTHAVSPFLWQWSLLYRATYTAGADSLCMIS